MTASKLLVDPGGEPREVMVELPRVHVSLYVIIIVQHLPCLSLRRGIQRANIIPKFLSSASLATNLACKQNPETEWAWIPEMIVLCLRNSSAIRLLHWKQNPQILPTFKASFLTNF